jgi:hypothetical protein
VDDMTRKLSVFLWKRRGEMVKKEKGILDYSKNIINMKRL